MTHTFRIGDRVYPKGNHRHATVLDLLGPGVKVRVQCDCRATFLIDAADLTPTPNAPPDDQAIAHGLAMSSHGGPS